MTSSVRIVLFLELHKTRVLLCPLVPRNRFLNDGTTEIVKNCKCGLSGQNLCLIPSINICPKGDISHKIKEKKKPSRILPRKRIAKPVAPTHSTPTHSYHSYHSSWAPQGFNSNFSQPGFAIHQFFPATKHFNVSFGVWDHETLWDVASAFQLCQQMLALILGLLT